MLLSESKSSAEPKSNFGSFLQEKSGTKYTDRSLSLNREEEEQFRANKTS